MKISYFKNWGANGTCYTQTITINKKEFIKIKKHLNKLKINMLNKYETMYFKTLENTPQEKNKKNTLYFLNLTQLGIISCLLQNNRILTRNTILKVGG